MSSYNFSHTSGSTSITPYFGGRPGETTLHFPDISSMFTDRQPVRYNKRIIWRTSAAFCQLMSSRAQYFNLTSCAKVPTVLRFSRSFYSSDGVYLRNFAGKADATKQTTFRRNRSTKRCLLLGFTLESLKCFLSALGAKGGTNQGGR